MSHLQLLFYYHFKFMLFVKVKVQDGRLEIKFIVKLTKPRESFNYFLYDKNE